MDWLIEDIEKNGPATTQDEVDQRPVPLFEGPPPAISKMSAMSWPLFGLKQH